jgi:glycosyltransferase involved in cell wall biosynthesis
MINKSFSDKGTRKTISVVTPCYNEEDNVYDVYRAIKDIRVSHPQYEWEHIFIDNSSVDKTLDLLKEIAYKDKRVKIIVNIRNFGHIRSHVHGYLNAGGDAVVVFLCDMQDPPELINEFLIKWEKGYKEVVGVKDSSEENRLMFFLRKIFYSIIQNISETDLIQNFTGFGLYDKSFLNIIRKLEDPYPYFRGLVAEYGQNRLEIPYTQRKRKKGKSKNNLYSLFDSAMLGFVNYSKVPLRLATFIGFVVSIISLLVGTIYFIYKLLFTPEIFPIGIVPLVVGLFFFGAVQLIFIGIIGEYVGYIHTQVLKRPLVIEKERINF